MIALTRFLDPLLPIAPLAVPALAIAEQLRHPAYDCFYLALAEERQATLVTADRRFAQRLVGTRWETLTATLGT